VVAPRNQAFRFKRIRLALSRSMLRTRFSALAPAVEFDCCARASEFIKKKTNDNEKAAAEISISSRMQINTPKSDPAAPSPTQHTRPVYYGARIN